MSLDKAIQEKNNKQTHRNNTSLGVVIFKIIIILLLFFAWSAARFPRKDPWKTQIM